MPIKNLIKRSHNTDFYFFSGKGGVGKTSMSAATALWFAKNGKKTLIISTDPAHSLSDSFEKQIGGEVIQIKKNLFGLEIDPKKSMEEYREKIEPMLGKMEAFKGMGLEDAFDVTSMAPGIDEIASFDKFMQYMNSDEYDIIVFDTAPTGHALRFLSLPDILDSWVGKIIAIKMKFSGIIDIFKKVMPFGDDDGSKKIGPDQLEEMKARIQKAKEVLSDPSRTHYHIVMIPEQMSIFESERSLEVLKQYHIPVEGIIVNQLIPENMKCSFCSEKRKIQQERLHTIKEKFSNYKIFQVLLRKEEVKGEPILEIISKELYD